jgi:hypothetical protein
MLWAYFVIIEILLELELFFVVEMLARQVSVNLALLLSLAFAAMVAETALAIGIIWPVLIPLTLRFGFQKPNKVARMLLGLTPNP